MRARLKYVYTTYQRENHPKHWQLHEDHLQPDEFDEVRVRVSMRVAACLFPHRAILLLARAPQGRGSVCLGEGFDLWILMSQLYDLAPGSFKMVRRCTACCLADVLDYSVSALCSR
jgi:hypothetical protein